MGRERRGGAANLGVRGLGGRGVIRGLGGQGADAPRVGGGRRPSGRCALPRRAAAKCAAPGLPSPGVRALHVTRVGGGLPARWAETKQRRAEQEGDPRLPQSLLQRKRSREANGAGRCTVQTRLLQAGYKTGAGRSDLGNRHAPARTRGARPPGVKRRRRLFRTTTREPASPLLPAPFAPETRRRPFRENRSARPAPPGPTTGGARPGRSRQGALSLAAARAAGGGRRLLREAQLPLCGWRARVPALSGRAGGL